MYDNIHWILNGIPNLARKSTDCTSRTDFSDEYSADLLSRHWPNANANALRIRFHLSIRMVFAFTFGILQMAMAVAFPF